jgi:hypothetical protein
MPFVDDRTRVTRIGDIGTQACEHMPKAEQVSIDVVPDLGGFSPTHAARWEFSYANAHRTSATSS